MLFSLLDLIRLHSAIAIRGMILSLMCDVFRTNVEKSILLSDIFMMIESDLIHHFSKMKSTTAKQLVNSTIDSTQKSFEELKHRGFSLIHAKEIVIYKLMTDTLLSTAQTILRESLGDHATFREGQWEAISSIVQKRQQLVVVQRTGWGKSLVYFIATRLMRRQNRGLTILISPLLSLMRNQIAQTKKVWFTSNTY